MSRRDSKGASTNLVTCRAEDLDLAGVDAGEGLLLKWVSEGDDSLGLSWLLFVSILEVASS